MVEGSQRKPPEECVTTQLDAILEELGNFGKYQILNCVLIFIPMTLCASYGLSYVFAVGESPHRCAIPECDSGVLEPPWLHNAVPWKGNTYDKCSRYASNNTRSAHSIDKTCPANLFDTENVLTCDKWVYSDSNSIVSEFDLGCHEWKRTLIGTMNNIGQLFGLPLSGMVSDKFGRRAGLTSGIVLSALAGLSRSFTTEYWGYLSLEFLDGAVGAGVYGAGFIMGVEYVGPKYRVLASSLISYSYAIGEVLLGLVAWLFPYWRTMLRVVYFPSVFLICYLWFLPESVRWLLAKGDIKATEKALNAAAKFNGVVLSEKSLQTLYHSIEYNNLNANEDSENEKSGKSKSVFFQMFKSRILMVRMFCCSLWWMTCTFVYFGLSLSSVSIAGDRYVNFILVSLVEIPGYFVYYFVVDRFGRRKSLCVSLLASGIACFAYIFVPLDVSWLQLCLYLFGKFSITVAFTVLYVYTTELFPTPLRASSMGACSMFGRFGSILAPQVPLLSIFMESLPLLLFGGTSICSGLMVLGFPETNNIKLPDTIEEAEQLSKKSIPKTSGPSHVIKLSDAVEEDQELSNKSIASNLNSSSYRKLPGAIEEAKLISQISNPITLQSQLPDTVKEV